MLQKWTPKSHQIKGICFGLANKRGAYFLDPGMGKTSTLLSVTRILKYIGKVNGVLLIAPLRVAQNTWPDEIEKWANFKNITSTTLHGEGKSNLFGVKKDVYLINPEGLRWLHDELLKGLKEGETPPFDCLIIDESTLFKNPKTKTPNGAPSRFQYLVNMLPLFNRRYILTGTPTPKSLMDLWSQMFILDDGKALTDNFYHFRNRYFSNNKYNKYEWNLKEGSQVAIQKKISPMVLELSAKDYLKMPRLIHNTIKVSLPAKAMKLYKEMQREYFIELDEKEASADQAATASMKCHQIANGKIYRDELEGEEKPPAKDRELIDIHSAKVEALRDLINEMRGKPLLIAYIYRHDLQALRGLLGDDLPHIGSGVSAAKTRSLIAKWNAGELPFLAGHPRSMGHGLNMQGGTGHLCWYSLTWDLEIYLQFNARIWRQGRKDPVIVHHLAARNTVDEAMLLRLGERAEQQRSLREALKMYRKQAV